MSDDLEPVHRIYLEVTEEQAYELISGHVPQMIRAMAMFLLSTEEDDRRAARPVPTRQKAKA